MSIFKKKKLTAEESRKRMSRVFVEWYLYQSGETDYKKVIEFEKELGLL